jgi:hypothetical protein
MSVGRGAIMKWKRERDLLLAQTMAFVQSVTGKPMDAEGPNEARQPLMSDRVASLDQTPTIARPVDVLPPRLATINQSDLRDEIRRRVAAFSDRQQAFHRDRDQYCNAMMEKARASSEQALKARNHRPPKA